MPNYSKSYCKGIPLIKNCKSRQDNIKKQNKWHLVYLYISTIKDVHVFNSCVFTCNLEC